MRKVLGLTVLIAMAAPATMPVTPAYAQAGTVPAGDALAQTPPVDVRKKQLSSAPHRFVRRYKRYKAAKKMTH